MSIPLFQHTNNKKWYHTVRFRVFLGVLSFLALQILLFVILFLQAEKLNKSNLSILKMDQLVKDNQDKMIPYTALVDLNTNSRQCELRVSVALGERFSRAKDGFAFLRREVRVVVNEKVTKFKRHEVFNFDKTMPVPMTKGSELMYPFDEYECQLEIEGFNQDQRIEFTEMTFDAIISSFNVELIEIDDPDNDSQRIYKIKIKREWVVKVFSIFLILLLLGIALSFFALGLQVLISKREIVPAILPVGLSIMFAIPALRTSLPSIPVIGIFIDTIGFLWSMALVSLSCIVIMICYGQRNIVLI